MLVIQFGRAGEPTQRFESVLPEIRIGSGFAEDLVIDDPSVGEHHCRLVMNDGKWLLVDEDSLHGTAVNGQRIRAPTPVAEHDRIGLGAFVLELRPEVEDPVEVELIAGAVRGDEPDAARAVYADWLEGKGEIERAEFLRLQPILNTMTPTHPRFAKVTARLRTLADKLDLGWRMKVARPIVEGCKVAKEFTCTMDWGVLAQTESPKIRACGVCKQHVHYCTNEREAIEHARKGHCVVVDFGSTRTVRPLEEAARERPIAPPGMYIPQHLMYPPAPPLRPPPPAPIALSLFTCPACNAANINPRCGQCGRDLS